MIKIKKEAYDIKNSSKKENCSTLDTAKKEGGKKSFLEKYT